MNKEYQFEELRDKLAAKRQEASEVPYYCHCCPNPPRDQADAIIDFIDDLYSDFPILQKDD